MPFVIMGNTFLEIPVICIGLAGYIIVPGLRAEVKIIDKSAPVSMRNEVGLL